MDLADPRFYSTTLVSVNLYEFDCFTILAFLLSLKYVLWNFRFLKKGGVMILATWLGQAAMEEQTTVLHVIIKVYT